MIDQSTASQSGNKRTIVARSGADANARPDLPPGATPGARFPFYATSLIL
jgi:hypothetical protein